MSLVVWLPLNGNLENQGISTITATGSGVTINTNGKIGSCYSFTGTTDYSHIKLDMPPFDNNTQEFSYCCWVKLNNSSSTTCLLSNRSETAAQGIGIFINSSGHDILFDTGIRTTWTQTIAANAWTHLAFVYKKNVTKDVYINGVLVFHTSTNTALTKATTTNAFIGASQYNTTTANANYLNGYLNDVRIYNHALSAAEVHEISQGLILHYKLDQPANINNNLYVGSEKFTGTWGNSGSWGESTETYQNFTVRQRGSTWSGLYQDIPCSQNDIFTISFYGKIVSGGVICSIHRSNLGNVTTGLTILGGNFIEGTNWVRATDDGTQWKRYWATVQIASADITYLRWRIENSVSGKTFQICGLKLERGNTPTPWSPAASEAGETNIIRDSSGYNHNGTIIGSPIISSDTARYTASTSFPANADGILSIYPIALWNNAFTYSFWIKPSNENGGRSIYAASYSGTSCSIEKTTGNKLRFYWGGSPDLSTSSLVITDGIWQHIAIVKEENKTTVKCYYNGILKDTNTKTISDKTLSGNLRIARDTRGDATSYTGMMSDFRIYCTALSAADVKQLYEMGAKVDNRGNLHCYEVKENNNNVLFKIESARIEQVFKDGLNKYTQANCQIALTNEGYHIYRPPNLTPGNDGNTMWGGLLINNQTTRKIAAYDATRDNVWNLQKNHTYMFAFHAKGQSSNSPSLIVESNMGWDRIAGVGPNPTYLASKTIPANFNGEQDCYIIFTIEDEIIKTATENKSSYVQGTQYLSYRELCLNYGYSNTGALGTDLYLTDFRLYDITSHIAQFTKQGIANFDDFVEENSIFKIRKNSEAITNNLIEL